MKAALLILAICAAAEVALAELRFVQINNEKPTSTYTHGDGSESTVTLSCGVDNFLVTVDGPDGTAFSSIKSTKGNCGRSSDAPIPDFNGESIVDPDHYEDEPSFGLTKNFRASRLELNGAKDVCLERAKASDPIGCFTHSGRVEIIEHLSTSVPEIHLVSHTNVDVSCCVRPNAAFNTVTSKPDNAEVEACKDATFKVTTEIQVCDETHVAWEVTADNGEWSNKEIGWMVESCTAENGDKSIPIFNNANVDVTGLTSTEPEIRVGKDAGSPNYKYTFDVHYFLPTGASDLVVNCAVRFCKNSGSSSLPNCPTLPATKPCTRQAGDFTMRDFAQQKVKLVPGVVTVNREL